MPIPAIGPTRSARSSVVESGCPRMKSRIAMLLRHHQRFGPFAQVPGAESHVGGDDGKSACAGLRSDWDADGTLLARGDAEFQRSGGQRPAGRSMRSDPVFLALRGVIQDNDL